MTKVNAKAVAAPTMEEMMEAYLKLKAENEALKAAKPERVAGISLDKLGRMAVQLPGSVAFSFYLDQWDKFAPQIDAAKAFIKANRNKMPDEATRKAAGKAREASKGK